MNRICTSLWWLTICLPAVSRAHHDALSQFDIDTFIQLEGKVTEVQWTYPHVLITIEIVEEQGRESWSLQTQAPAVLRQLGIRENPLHIGDEVRSYGWAPRAPSQRESFVFNLLLPSGEELVLESGGERKFSQ